MDGQGNGESLGMLMVSKRCQANLIKSVQAIAVYNQLFVITHYYFTLMASIPTIHYLSLERMSLGGPYTVRAYPVAEYVRDTAVFTSLSWVINGGVF